MATTQPLANQDMAEFQQSATITNTQLLATQKANQYISRHSSPTPLSSLDEHINVTSPLWERGWSRDTTVSRDVLESSTCSTWTLCSSLYKKSRATYVLNKFGQSSWLKLRETCKAIVRGKTKINLILPA